MNNKRNIFIDILIMSVLVAFAVVMFFLVAPSKELKAQENESVVNLASPNLADKEYLGNGFYRITVASGLTLDYNVYSGNFIINGTPTANAISSGNLFNIPIDVYSFSFYKVSGTSNLDRLFYNSQANDNVFIEGIRNNDIIFNENVLTNSNIISLILRDSSYTNYDNYAFKLQIEKGTTTRPYQVPIGALEQHIQLQKDISFNDGYNDGYNDGLDFGYNDGFNDGLDQAFNSNNLITSTDYTILERGQAGPHFDFFGLYFDNVNIKVKDIMLLNLSGTSLQNIDVGYSGSYQNITLRFTDNTSKTFYFKDYYDSLEPLMLFNNDNDKLVKSITISLLATPSMSYPDFEALLNDYKRTLGLYLNNRILSDEAIDTFKEIIENDLRNELEIEYQNELDNLLDFYLKAEFDKGYEKGVNESDTTYTGVFTIITNAIFKPIALIFGIELLPNISLGMIILVPLLFGLIAFVVGGKKK